jgi:hypothetical protein
VGGVVEVNLRAGLLVIAAACCVACDDDATTGPSVPSEVANAPSTALIEGVPVGVTAFASRTFSSTGTAVGETQWVARVVSPPGAAVPALTAVELWFVTGETGRLVPIASSRVVTEATDPYLQIQGSAGTLNPGAKADVVVRVRDAMGNLFLVRTANVPVQRSELLDLEIRKPWLRSGVT